MTVKKLTAALPAVFTVVLWLPFAATAETEASYASESSKKLTVTTDKKQLPDGETLININGQWQYFKDGKQNFDYCGLVSFYGTLYYVENGVLNWGYTGYTNYYGTWYYVEGGVLR